MTTSINNLRHLKEVVDEYITQHFCSIFIRSLNPYGFAKRDKKYIGYEINEFIEEYKRVLDYIIEQNLNGKYLVESFAALLLTRILTPFSTGFVDMQSPAGAAISGAIYNYDGNVYPSDEARMIAEMGDEYFQLGNVNHNHYYDIFYGKKAKLISENWSNECLAGCSECAFQSYCGADPIRNYSIQGDMYGFRPTSDFCRKNKLIFKHLIQLVEGDRKIEEIFNSWISQ